MSFNTSSLRIGLCALFLALVGPPGGAMAQTGALGDSLRRGDVDGARALLDTQVAGRADAQLHRAHLEGLIALRQGDARKAVEIFEAIVDIAPGFEPSRLALVQALHVAGRRGTAIAQARRLADTTEDAQLRDQLLNQIALTEGARRGGVALRFSLLPSSNITGGSSAETVTLGGVPFVLDAGSRKARGIGISLGVTAWRSWVLGRQWTATAAASLDRRIFDTRLKPDETELSLRLNAAWRGQRGELTFGPRLALLRQPGGLARRQAGIGLAGAWLISPRLRFTLSAEWLRQEYPQAPFRTGHLTSLVPGLQWAVSPRTTLFADLPVLRETARAPHLAHRDLGLGLGIATRLPEGLNLGLSAFAGRNRYDGVYPGFSITRRDTVRSLRVSLSHDKITLRGVRPEISVTRRWQASNIPLHDITTTDFGLSLSRRF